MGHLRRCLSLAAALMHAGARVVFIVNRAGHLAELFPPGLDVVEVDDDEINSLVATRQALQASSAAALVTDSYAVSAEPLMDMGVPTATIVDGVPAQPLPVALVTDSAIDAASYAWPSSDGTQLLLGPAYVLLRPMFAEARPRRIAGDVRKVLVTTGGADHARCCGRFIAAARDAYPAATIDVIVGPYFTSEAAAAVHRLSATDRRIVVHRRAVDMVGLLRDADVAVTGGGQTLYELAATGTPTVAISLAANQHANLRGFAARGALVWAGDAGDVDLEARIAAALRQLAPADVRSAMSAAGQTLVDGRGASRIATAVLNLAA